MSEKQINPPVATGSFKRRDHLASIEAEIQKLWNENRVYEVSAPEWQSDFSSTPIGEFDSKNEKFFCTFPYPYMNGRLHLGHAFTITKAEFQARYQRLQGKRVLWPFAFHCTGMPIAACADKLKREVAEREHLRNVGTPSTPESPWMSSEVSDITPVTSTVSTPQNKDVKEIGKFTGKKSKAVAKIGVSKTQWDIMEASGVPKSEIPNFVDPHYWLSYFPLLGKSDLQRFGMAVDWRRSFITTDRNPYYDAFVRWQFNTLKKRNRIKFGMRPSVFSRIENQPCADHDRAAGEGAAPQEYTLIKIKIQTIPQNWINSCVELRDKNIFLVAATLRPETMYGQTNCFILPEGEYGMFIAFDNPVTCIDCSSEAGVLQRVMNRADAIQSSETVFICSERSADNMGFQGILPIEDDPHHHHRYKHPICLKKIKGIELMGLPLSAPYAFYETVYSLPMMGISMDKGTGVVTSVPSDAPDDYAALRDLQEKETFRQKYGITKEMVDFDVVEIIEVPGLGRRAAVDVCIAKKIKSQNDKIQIAEAKEEVYKKGFYEGIMLMGSQKGQKVCDSKIKVREELIANGFAISYYEPEFKVISRSGDNCVVALCNQWYEDYGEVEWKSMVDKYIHDSNEFNAYSTRCFNQFVYVVNWLREWACSRHYGLGTFIPWEKENKVLIESLSDSTIYMAYYTIAHLLQGDLYGDSPGELGIHSDQLDDDVFDFIFMQTDEFINKTSIPKDKLNKLRYEFSYWYPMDLRVSGKDLIFNHLTMSLYNHAAIWPSKPHSKWPKSFFCNGHVLVDAEKMSKSAGNFLTLRQAIDDYTADATRIGLADAGDSLDDANFQRDNANSAIMRLYLLDQFVEEMINQSGSLRKGEKLWMDLAFENEIINLSQQAKFAFDKMMFRDSLKYGFFDFATARDLYRNLAGPEGMHQDSIMIWIETQSIILSPIAPHVSEYIWSIRLKKPTLIINQSWPIFDNEYDHILHREFELLFNSIEDFRKVKEKTVASLKKHQVQNIDISTYDAIIYVGKDYLPWQQTVLKILQTIPLDESKHAPLDTNFMSVVKSHPDLSQIDKKLIKDVMSFASFRMKDELATRGPPALELQLPFNEFLLMKNNVEFIQRSLGLNSLSIKWNTEDRHEKDETDRIDLALPSKPSIVFFPSSKQQ